MAFLTQNETDPSGFQRDKDRLSKRFQTNFEAIIAKYDRPFVESDVLDLNNLTVVEDRGFLTRAKKSRIGTTKLAADKVSPHKSARWDSTKDSTDSALGSTRLSESEDTSGTETIVNYTYQNPTHVNEEEREKVVLRMDDVLMSRNSHSEDSGNEDVDSDHSGPICTPTRSSLTKLMHHQENRHPPSNPICPNHQRARGNLSKKFQDEYQLKEKNERGMFKELSENDNEEEEEDPYEFKDELPSILEERNRFLSKMQSILADSFSDGDGIDEMDSPSDGEASTGTIESSEATSGSISPWSTLHSRPTPKRTSTVIPPHGNDERLLDGLTINSTDSDYTECSTILAGNLHTDRQLFRPSNLLSKANQNRDSRSNMSQLPFEAICNSTMLSEIQPPAVGTAKRKPHLDLDRHRELELPLDGQGEMCLGEVPLNAQFKSDVRSESFDDNQTKTPKSKRNSEYRTPAKYDDTTRKSNHVSSKSNTPTTRNHNPQDSMSQDGCDVTSVTPRAGLRKGVKVNRETILHSPRFDTQEIIELFRSPKPLIIPGIDLGSLDLTPRRRVKREGTGTPTTGPLKNALLRLQIPSSSKAEKSTNHRSQSAKEIISPSSDPACEMTLDCTRYDSESDDNPGSETLVCKSNVSSDDTPKQTTRTPKTSGVVETASDRKHQREVVEAASIARLGSKQHVKEDFREPKTSPPIKKDKSVSKMIHTSTESLNLTEQQRKHSKVCRADLGVTDSQVRQTARHHRSSHSTDAPQLNVDSNSVSPKSDHQRTWASIKHDTGSKYRERKLSEPKQLMERSENNTGKKSTQHSRNPKETSAKDVQDDLMNRSPLSLKTQKAKRSILTPTVERSPSTLSSPLNRMTLTSPQARNGSLKDKLSKGSKKKTAEQAVRKKQKKLSEYHPKSRHMDETLRMNERGQTSKEFNSTHMTIRDFDDDSEDEMEVDFDPYSLTADDSSPGPNHFHRRHTPHSNGKSARSNYNDHGGNEIKGKDRLRSSQTRANLLSQKFQEHYRDLDKDTRTPTKQYRHSRQSESYEIDLRNSEKDREFRQSSPLDSKKEKVSGNKTAVLNSAASLPVKNNSRTALTHEERRLVARVEHTLYFSDEESNSSGDSAKFLSLAPNHSVMETRDIDPAGVPVAIPADNKRNHADRAGSYKIKHKTIIRCGQIISSPKSTKSSSRNLNSSPPRTGRVEKSRKIYANSPTRSFQSDTKAVRSSTKVNQRGQPAKTVVRRLIASPMKKLDDHVNSENVRSLVSSPLCSSGCNVSSSYICEGPGHCTKPFCFSCALSELS